MKHYIYFIISLVFITISCSKEKREWVEVKKLDSIPMYMEFLKKFPDGSYADSAKNKIESRQISIYSIPDSLNIYFGLPDLLIKDGEVKINDEIERSELFKIENKKGVTPIKLNDINSGQYIIGIMPVEFWDSNLSLQCFDPFLEYLTYVSSIPWQLTNQNVLRNIRDKLKSGELKQEGGIVYIIKKDEKKLSTVIILAKENITLDEYDKYYPKENNFIFNSIKFKQDLHNKNALLSEEELQKTVELLQRGGKIILNNGVSRSSIEIIDSLNWNIIIEANVYLKAHNTR